MPETTLYESPSMRIGKHDWRVIVKPFYLGGNCTEYQWRPANLHGLPDELHARREPWRSGEEWPGYNFNDTYLGLPRTLRTLYDREKPQLDRHLYGIEPPPDPQIGFDFSAPASSPQDDAASLARFPRSALMSDKPTHSPAPWGYEYNSYTVRAAGDSADAVGTEIPAFQVFDAEGNKVFETNEDTPSELQEANARLATAAPQMRDALKLAQQALNTAPRFRVGETDSYKIASVVDKAPCRRRSAPPGDRGRSCQPRPVPEARPRPGAKR